MKVITFGEIMMRLKSPGHERFFQSPNLEATFGGGEANVAVKSTVAGKPVPSSVRSEKAMGQSGADNFFARTAGFFREVKVELKKVVWPSRKQTTGTTVVVVIFVFVVAVFLGIFDYSLSKLVQVVLT